MEIRKELVAYVEENIKPRYAEFDTIHDVDHFYFVVNNCIAYTKELFDNGIELDVDMAYTIGAYHDLGLIHGEDMHTKYSADILRQDKKLRDFFTEAEIETMAIAIEDHASLLETEPRNIYGKLIADAERSNSIRNVFERPIMLSLENDPEDMSKTKRVNKIIKFVEEKFGKDGYVNFWLGISAVATEQRNLWELLEDKQKCREFVNKLYDDLKSKLN
ncbi:MAG: HD domain-containing protein [Clostridia bacterium]|nr:HD domain-containing protein [Clostridia bacterium]